LILSFTVISYIIHPDPDYCFNLRFSTSPNELACLSSAFLTRSIFKSPHLMPFHFSHLTVCFKSGNCHCHSYLTGFEHSQILAPFTSLKLPDTYIGLTDENSATYGYSQVPNLAALTTVTILSAHSAVIRGRKSTIAIYLAHLSVYSIEVYIY
jgi:hypothetical protein